MRQLKQLDFSGQEIFAGIDVHKKSWKVCIRTKDLELRTFSQDPSAEILSSHLKKNYPSATHKVVYEAGFCGFGFQREFDRLGVNCIVVHPADVPTTDKEKQRKTDAVDCRKLSKTLSDGGLKGIYIPSIEQQDDRGILRVYHQCMKNQTRYKNQIKGWLYYHGVQIPDSEDRKYWSRNFISWLKTVPLATDSARISLDILIQGFEQTRNLVLIATRQLRALSNSERHKAQIDLLRTIPGVGPITSLMFVVEIGDINRFKGLDNLCDYVGLVPRVHSSGDKTHESGLTYRGNQKLRETLIEASWTTIRLDPAMTMAYTTFCKTMESNKAIIKIARKLLNRIRFVMKNQKKYETGKVE
jgi:transposase